MLEIMLKKRSRMFLLAGVAVALLAFFAGPASADMEAAKKWVEQEFQPSTLTKDQQMKEMEFFINAAKPFVKMSQDDPIRVVSETIPTHEYEAKVLTKAFEEITGIKVSFDLIQEGDVIEKLQSQWASGKNLYDGWINDSDLIGTHWRYGYVVPLSDFMKGEGKDVTLPTLDVDDFMGKSFTTAPDGKLYQLPDQQFANLYWFRYDWFNREDFKKKFKEIYGYELGVPVNWSAYEDIADFFTNDVKEIDGVRVYGHMDYGKRAPDLGWRMTDAWLSMAGAGDKGIPNGIPVDEWGIRMEDCRPVGATVALEPFRSAVLVTTGGRTLLYDSGPGDGAEGNLVASVVAPALNRLGNSAPDRVVISHGDLDHAGGLVTLRQRFPDADYRVNLRDRLPGLARCAVPLNWQWNDVSYVVLHPTASLPYLGNDSSCVLSIGRGDNRLLLSGDISATVERRLVSEGLPEHEILLVPHHGSKTSSSPEFLAAVRPRIAMVTASLGNRFGFPKAEVEARYRRAGVRFWSTGDCGALRIVIGADGKTQAVSARRQRTGMWRWPPAADCP